jgi:hypothetical protein
MLDFIERRIMNNWSTYFPHRAPPKGLQPLILCSSPYRSVIMYFDDGRSHPFLKVKVGFPVKYICREHEALSHLRQTVSASVRVALPRPLDMFEYGGRVAAFEECVDGITLFVKYNRSLHKDSKFFVYADQALEWLITFAAETKVSASVLPACLSEITSSKVWETCCPAAVTSLVQQCCERLGNSSLSLALTAGHGDFWMGNLLFRDHTLTGVIDWEYAYTAGESTSDLFHFLLTLANYLDRTEPDRTRLLDYPSWGQLPDDWLKVVTNASTLVKAMRFVFFDDNCFARYAKDRTARHLQRIAIDPALAADLFSLYLARQASLFYSIAQEDLVPCCRPYYREFIDLLSLWQMHASKSWLSNLA